MKKTIMVLLITLIAITTISLPAQASVARVVKDSGPYEGTFLGYVYGDRGSRAELTLDLTHDGTIVMGSATIGEGLYISAGRCGGGMLPEITQEISGRSLAKDPNLIQAETEFSINGFTIGFELESQLSKDGKTLEMAATIDIPWICGRDPVLTGTLYREN